MDLLAEFRTGNTIEAHTEFGSLNRKLPMDIRRYTDHKLAAVRPACNRLRESFPGPIHIFYNIRY